jgi:hypothetical protein
MYLCLILITFLVLKPNFQVECFFIVILIYLQHFNYYYCLYPLLNFLVVKIKSFLANHLLGKIFQINIHLSQVLFNKYFYIVEIKFILVLCYVMKELFVFNKYFYRLLFIIYFFCQ